MERVGWVIGLAVRIWRPGGAPGRFRCRRERSGADTGRFRDGAPDATMTRARSSSSPARRLNPGDAATVGSGELSPGMRFPWGIHPSLNPVTEAPGETGDIAVRHRDRLSDHPEAPNAPCAGQAGLWLVVDYGLVCPDCLPGGYGIGAGFRIEM